MSLQYVCNVASEDGGEPPLELPAWDFQTNAARAGRKSKMYRRDGQDVISGDRNDDGSMPGDPGLPPVVGSVREAGVRARSGDRSDNGSVDETPLLLPTLFPKRRGATDYQNQVMDRSPSDFMAEAADNDADGDECNGTPAMPWPSDIYRKRKAGGR